MSSSSGPAGAATARSVGVLGGGPAAAAAAPPRAGAGLGAGAGACWAVLMLSAPGPGLALGFRGQKSGAPPPCRLQPCPPLASRLGPLSPHPGPSPPRRALTLLFPPCPPLAQSLLATFILKKRQDLLGLTLDTLAGSSDVLDIEASSSLQQLASLLPCLYPQ